MAVLNQPPQALFTERALSALYRTTLGTVLAWNDARVTRTALSRLSDQELRDIGLVRGDIDVIAGTL